MMKFRKSQLPTAKVHSLKARKSLEILSRVLQRKSQRESKDKNLTAKHRILIHGEKYDIECSNSSLDGKNVSHNQPVSCTVLQEFVWACWSMDHCPIYQWKKILLDVDWECQHWSKYLKFARITSLSHRVENLPLHDPKSLQVPLMRICPISLQLQLLYVIMAQTFEVKAQDAAWNTRSLIH